MLMKHNIYNGNIIIRASLQYIGQKLPYLFMSSQLQNKISLSLIPILQRKGKKQSQQKVAILTKERISVKCFREVVLYIQIKNIVIKFFRKKKHDKIRHLNFTIINR